MQQSADKGQTAHMTTFIYPVVMARKWGLTKAVKDKMSAVEESFRSILAPHPETASSSDVLYGGTLGYSPGAH
jgi:hypothetical protein